MDSFSLFGLNKKRLKIHFEQAKQGYTEIKGVSDDEIFSVAVNIGGRNFNKYTEFIQEVKDKMDVKIEERGLLGGHDVSIIT